MINDKNVVVPTAGGDRETSGLIRVCFQERLIVVKEHDSNLMGPRLELWGKVVFVKG